MKDEYGKSGAGGKEITKGDFTDVEWLALDFKGVACVEGMCTLNFTLLTFAGLTVQFSWT